jgi:hypothetical protein
VELTVWFVASAEVESGKPTLNDQGCDRPKGQATLALCFIFAHLQNVS